MSQIKSLIGETKGEKYFHPLLDVTRQLLLPQIRDKWSTELVSD